MIIIRSRFISLETETDRDTPMLRSERLALHVRKIVEGVAFGALSACEHRNAQVMREQRTKDADKLLTWLDQRKLLHLPSAQRIKPSPSPEYGFIMEGAGTEDLDLLTLKAAYSRASALVHERHPERLGEAVINAEIMRLEEDAQKLRSWLWLHTMFLKGEAFLVQMGQYGNVSFFVPLSREGDLPAEFAR